MDETKTTPKVDVIDDCDYELMAELQAEMDEAIIWNF